MRSNKSHWTVNYESSGLAVNNSNTSPDKMKQLKKKQKKEQFSQILSFEKQIYFLCGYRSWHFMYKTTIKIEIDGLG